MSGRRRAQVFEDARLLGQSSFIYEAGACVVLDGEEHWLTGELLPGELTIAEQIERSGAPALLLEHYAGRLEYHEPWHVEREVSHLFRGLVDAGEVDALLREHGHGDLRLVDNGVVNRRSPALAELPHVRGYHLRARRAPRRRPRSRFHSRARGYAREETFAVGDSREDLACAARGRTSSGWSPTRSSATPRSREALAAHDNVRVAEAGHGAGVYEAVVSTLMARSGADARRRADRAAQPRRAARCQPRPRRAAPARRRRHGRAHERDPVVERQLAGDQPRRGAPVTGALTPARSSARASSGTDSSASTAWPTRAGISAGGHARGEQLAGAAVAALARERGRDEVAGAGEPDHRLRPRARAPRRSARPRRRCARRRRRRRSAPAPRSRRRRARRRSSRRRRARRRAGRWTARRRRRRA